MILTVEVFEYIPVNSYFYIDDETLHGFLIDPGAQADKLLHIIEERKFIIEKILLTHGHFDHIGAVEELQKNLHAQVCMQRNGKDYVENPDWNLSQEIILNDVTYLDDGDIILNANPNFKLNLISTPGHTTDGAIYYSIKDKVAFVGDSIFAGSYGRTDFPGGDEKVLFNSIKNKILTLPDETILLSGHSEPTTVEIEKTRY